MRFLKKKIACANALHQASRGRETQLANLSLSDDSQTNNKPKKSKRPQQKHLKSTEAKETKNIVKNYGKAICKFSTSSLALPYLKGLIQNEGVESSGFVNFVNSVKDQIEGLHHFRSILLPNEKDDKETAAYRRIFRSAGSIFIKLFSVNWIFYSKIIHKKAHIEFRFKMLRRIQHPESFTYLKAWKQDDCGSKEPVLDLSMFKPTINNLQESTSLLPSFKLSNISQKKNDSALPRLKSVNSSKLNLKKLVINADPSPITSPRNVLHEGSSSLSTNRSQPIQSAHLSPLEKSTSKILKTEPNRSVTLERINKTVNLTIKDFGQIGSSPRSGQEDPRSPLSLRSPRRLLAITTPREIDSVSLDESKILASNFSKFNNYLASLKKLESRKSPLAKETFYYPEQLEMNKRFKRIEGEMKSVDEKGLFHFRTIREGKKEKIRLPIGTKTYMRLDCVGKTFPLHVRVETKLGTFQIFVSRTQERPERRDCDYYFSQAHFEIDYLNPEKVKTLYFHVLGTGNMELSITMNFSEMQESKNSNVAKSQIMTSKGTSLTPRYEIFHEHMTREEERNLKEIADEIKRERAERIRAQNRDAISSNFSLAAEYPKIKKEQQAEFIQKRDFTLYKNREKRAHLMQRKKLRQVCDMMKPDVKKVVRSWKMQKDIEIHQQLTVQKSWLVLAALCFIGKEIREKKRVALAWRVITRIKDHAACRIQRMVRNYLSRSIEIKGRKTEDKEDEGQNEVNQHQDLVMLNMFNAINTAVLQWKQIQKQNAQKVLGSFFRDFSFAAKISKAAKNYSVRVSKIQRKWKQKMNVVNARVDIFLTCWNEYCGLLLSESKAKNKLLAAFGKIKEQQVREKGKKFVQKRMGNGTMQFIIDAFKTQHNSSKMPTSIIPSLIQDKGTRTSLRRGSKLARGSLLHLTRDSISELQNPAESRFIPSLAELKDIFDTIVKEMEAEDQSK